jgi:hypothetical protein
MAGAAPVSVNAQQVTPAELARQVSATGLPGGWAGSIANADFCSVAVEQYAVEGGRVKYQVRLVRDGTLTPPVYYDIIAVDGTRVTLREDGHSDNEAVTVEGDQLTTNSGQARHRCPA